MTRRHLQYTVRNVPPAVDQALRRRARQLGRSLNDVALEALARGAGLAEVQSQQTDLDHFFGSWVEDPETNRALADQRPVDEDLWK